MRNHKMAFPSRAPMMRAMLSRVEKAVIYFEGIYIDNRLVTIYYDKDYCHKWKDLSNNEPQIKMGVNMVVFALIQKSGIAKRYVDYQEQTRRAGNGNTGSER